MGGEVEAMRMQWNGSGSKEEIVECTGWRVYTIGASQVVSGDNTSAREIHDTNRKVPERVHYTKHESQRMGKETRGSGERQKRSGIRERVLERPEGVDIVGIKRKRGEKGDIITGREMGHTVLRVKSDRGKRQVSKSGF